MEQVWTAGLIILLNQQFAGELEWEMEREPEPQVLVEGHRKVPGGVLLREKQAPGIHR